MSWHISVRPSDPLTIAHVYNPYCYPLVCLFVVCCLFSKVDHFLGGSAGELHQSHSMLLMPLCTVPMWYPMLCWLTSHAKKSKALQALNCTYLEPHRPAPTILWYTDPPTSSRQVPRCISITADFTVTIALFVFNTKRWN